MVPRPKLDQWRLEPRDRTDSRGVLQFRDSCVRVRHNCADFENYLGVWADTFAEVAFYACCPSCGSRIPTLILIQAHLLAQGP